MNTAQKNKRVALGVLGVVVAMIGLAYASVPLYDLFCRVTGFGGTPQRVAGNTSVEILDRKMTVRFNTDVAPNLPWDFRPDQKDIVVNVGQSALVSFTARNESATPVVGTAVFNVTPAKAGKYFNKIECFCFGEQVLTPGQSIHMPVVFYIDPEIADDPNLDDVTTVTLSYSFFKKDSKELEGAMEKFYNAPDTN